MVNHMHVCVFMLHVTPYVLLTWFVSPAARWPAPSPPASSSGRQSPSASLAALSGDDSCSPPESHRTPGGRQRQKRFVASEQSAHSTSHLLNPEWKSFKHKGVRCQPEKVKGTERLVRVERRTNTATYREAPECDLRLWEFTIKSAKSEEYVLNLYLQTAVACHQATSYPCKM